MDLSALLSGLITENTVKEVSKKSGASKKDVSSVLTTALPLLLTSGNNTTAAQVSEQSGVSQNTTSNVLSAAAPLLLGSLGGSNNQQQSQGTSAATNIALLGALLGKVDLGKLTSGLMGLVSTNTANTGDEACCQDGQQEEDRHQDRSQKEDDKRFRKEEDNNHKVFREDFHSQEVLFRQSARRRYRPSRKSVQVI